MKIGIFTGGTSVRSKNIFTDISRYPTGKHKISYDISLGHCRLPGGFYLPFIIFIALTLSASWAKSWSFADNIDQDQTAQNVQSDLDLCCPLVKIRHIWYNYLWDSVDPIYCRRKRSVLNIWR